jgi:hypothetical protein
LSPSTESSCRWVMSVNCVAQAAETGLSLLGLELQ